MNQRDNIIADYRRQSGENQLYEQFEQHLYARLEENPVNITERLVDEIKRQVRNQLASQRELSTV
jgi:hypothetical protein